MLKSIPWRLHIAWSLLCAILFCIPVFILLTNPKFSLIWLLYLGNGAFLIALVTHIFRYNRSIPGGATSMGMMGASVITTMMGILLSFVICWLLIIIMIPGLFNGGIADKTLAGAPAATIGRETHGLIFMIIMSVTAGNFSVGLFASIIFPFTLKLNQTKEEIKPGEFNPASGKENPNHAHA